MFSFSCLNRKYNTLIQAQARELSYLRQRMREGRSICHILTHHLSDTTKAFEELLRANDIDYYMGQSFREQLSQSSSLAQRVSSKMSGRERSYTQHNSTGNKLVTGFDHHTCMSFNTQTLWNLLALCGCFFRF